MTGSSRAVLGHQVEVIMCTAVADSPVTLVFLHEGLGSAKQWRDFPARVGDATGVLTYAYSRLGYGDSDPVPVPRPLTYMHDEARDFLPRLLDQLCAGGDAILVGHSDGASIALIHAALDGGARVRGLVLEAPHVFVEDVTIASIAKAREAYATGDLREKLARHHKNVDVAFRGWNDAWLDPAFRAWNLESYLPRITVPVLVIQGDDDPYGTRAQVDAIAAQVNAPAEVLMLPACGHAPHRDQPRATLAAMTSFIRRLLHHPH